ncbi:hypothetical protein CGLO_18247 [Colletotrichum gloeosporioides Cg-14]|uniref:Uncharacterized protein n=1 Tax=Colletotrichum gloeosporioides (strain Cg-14) TaxID=1237896 RepID=T0L4I4_COLGC|nr:hypothetical protein CGLO_18247 [Colletotrichum gloeosporioides Cg-14]
MAPLGTLIQQLWSKFLLA